MACLVGKDGNRAHRLRSPVAWPGKSADSRLNRIETQFEVPSQARAGPCGSSARARAYIKKIPNQRQRLLPKAGQNVRTEIEPNRMIFF